MVVTQQTPYAPGSSEQWQFPGNGQGWSWQAPAAAPPQPIDPDEFAQQLRDLAVLTQWKPLYFFWVRGRRWSATLNVGERAGARVEADSAGELAELLGGTTGAPSAFALRVSQGGPQPQSRNSAPPVQEAHPLATGRVPVPPLVAQLAQRESPQPGQPWQPQAGSQGQPSPAGRAQPLPQASGAA